MRRTLLIGLLALTLSACGGSAATSSTASSGAASAEMGNGAPAAPAGLAERSGGAADAFGAPQPATDPVKAAPPVEGQQTAPNQNPQAPAERLVIRTATLQLLVENVVDAEAQVRRLADTRGGFVLSSQSSGEDTQRRASVALKIPAGRFDDVITELGKLAIKVEAQDVQGQDVTDEFVDLESRMRNLRAVEARLQKFLADATRIDDLLQINQQLSDIQGQIEQAQGRITYLKQSAALSTITVSLYAKPVIDVVPDEGWSPGSTARAAAKLLIAFAQNVADVAIVFAVWAPLWLPLVLAALWYRRRTRRPLPPTPPAPQTSQP